MDIDCWPACEDGGEGRVWTHLFEELLRLSSLYQRWEDGRRFLRCESILKALEALLRRHGKGRGLVVGEILKTPGSRSEEDAGTPEEIQEAAGWWRSIEASFWLASLYGIGGGDPDLALRISDVHREIRAGIQCVYPDEAGRSLIRAATGQTLGRQEERFLVWARTHLPSDSTGPLMQDAM